nr:methyltransferase domain-containing protein [Anaplasma marginale]
MVLCRIYMSCGSTCIKGVRGAFDKAASSYDEYSAFQRNIAGELCALVHGVDGKKVLDVGCGTGHVGAIIGNRCELSQVDASQEMCNIANKKIRGLTVSCDMENMPFPDGFFDVVTSSMAIHWAYNISACLRSMLRVLNETGQGLFISVPVQGTLEELAVCERLMGRKRKFEFHDVAFFEKLVPTLGATIEYVQCKKYTLQHKTCMRLLNSIAKIGAQSHRSAAETSGVSIADVCRVYSDLFSQNGMVISSWNIAYLVIKKRFC